jgi:hypothetical protein
MYVKSSFVLVSKVVLEMNQAKQKSKRFDKIYCTSKHTAFYPNRFYSFGAVNFRLIIINSLGVFRNSSKITKGPYCYWYLNRCSDRHEFVHVAFCLPFWSLTDKLSNVTVKQLMCHKFANILRACSKQNYCDTEMTRHAETSNSHK